METNVFNYRIIVEPDTRTGSNETCYTAFCPTLSIADSGDTIEEAIANIKNGIEVWIESLVKDGKEVPVDRIDQSIITFTSVNVPSNIRISTL